MRMYFFCVHQTNVLRDSVYDPVPPWAGATRVAAERHLCGDVSPPAPGPDPGTTWRSEARRGGHSTQGTSFRVRNGWDPWYSSFDRSGTPFKHRLNNFC